MSAEGVGWSEDAAGCPAAAAALRTDDGTQQQMPIYSLPLLQRNVLAQLLIAANLSIIDITL